LENVVLVCKAATWDYHGQMNGTDFREWAYGKLAPNMPCASAVILDNAVSFNEITQGAFEICSGKKRQSNGSTEKVFTVTSLLETKSWTAVLMAVSMDTAVFSVVAPCKLV
jgi:hypothetical protein